MLRVRADWKRSATKALFFVWALFATASSATIAQSADDPTAASKSGPTVSVAEIVGQTVPVSRVYTGTTAAAKAVELKAQVTGYLLEREFVEGSNVKQGDVLYIIEPRRFVASLQQKQAQLQEQEAILDYAKTAQKRYAAAAKAGAAAQEQLDQAVELEARTEAAIGAYQAEIELAQIDVDFTTIAAPFDGLVGRTLVNIGALVKENETTLTSLLQVDPIYVYFNPPETELLQIEAQQAESPLDVTVTLPHATKETFKGTLTFISNAADAQTGTITMRATVPNPDQRIRPGQFALVDLHIGEHPDALVVPAKAVSSVQGQHFVMIVAKDNKLERRSVRLGSQVGALGYIVEHGLKKGDLVVVSDIRTLKVGETVSPQRKPAS